MSHHATTRKQRNARLSDLLERLTDRMHQGDLGDDDAGGSRHVEELTELVPVLRLLAQAASGDPDAAIAEVPQWKLPDDLVLDDFRIIGEIGRGGMGVVYEAEQISLQRSIALKVLPFTASLDVQQLRRFENEIRATAALDHPHIVRVYAAGNFGGVHYYAMQLVHGKSLAKRITDRQQLVRRCGPGDSATYYRQAVSLGMQAAHALQHAHDAGVIHQDIKPSNLLVADDDHVWITDFGLARFCRYGSLKAAGNGVGTLRYMSPEQARGRAAIIDHRTDVYSLGATLYELLTLRPAYSALDHDSLRDQIVRHDFPAPRQVQRTLPRDLETVVLKAMAAEPQERYATAQELAEDLQRFQDHRPILAQRPTLRDRASKAVQRNAPLAWLGTALVLVITCGLTAGLVLLTHQRDAAREAARREGQLARDAWQQEELAETERQRAEDNFARARQAVDRMMRSAAVDLANVGGSDMIRRDLLLDALDFYKGFLQQQPDNAAVQYDLGLAYARVGEIHHRLGQDQQAEIAIEQACGLLRELAYQPGTDPRFRLALAQVLQDLAHVCLELSGHFERALDLTRERVHLLKAFLVEHPDSRSVRRELSVAHTDWGLILVELQQLAEAESQFHEALDLWHQKTRDGHLEPADVQALAATHRALGKMLTSTARYEEARLHLGDASELQTTLATTGSPADRDQLAYVQQDVAALWCKTGDRVAAESCLRDAVANCQQLVEKFPDAVDYAKHLADCQYEHYRVLLALEQDDEAYSALTASSQGLEALLQRADGLLKYAAPLARNHYILGIRAYHAGDMATAEAAFARVNQLLESSLMKFPDAAAIRAQFAWFLVTCPDAQRQNPVRAMELASAAVEQRPQHAPTRRILAAVHYRQGRYLDALEAVRQSAASQGCQDGFDLFLSALCHARLAERSQAIQSYDLALRWIADHPCDLDLLAPLQWEATAVLATDRGPSVD